MPQSSPSGHYKGKLRVLAVDDDQEIRELLNEILTHLGHASVTAEDGIDALEKLSHQHFDMVITDLKMPRMGGIELIKRIKTGFEDVDVIAVTVYGAEYDYTEVIGVGASDFVDKPFNADELEAKINRIVRERSLRAELRRLSTRDGLTGLYNRRYFDQNLRHEAIRAFRQNYNMYLLFIDLDNLKEYNDNYGHQQGDNLLRDLAKILLGNIRRDVDSAYRYGGDEFAVVLPHATRRQALMVAERLITEYNMRNFVPTSLSVGLAQLETTRETLEEDLQSLIGKADEALYRAKTSSGNQLCDDRGQSYQPAPPYESGKQRTFSYLGN
jgi:two-component system cell cycle response regulator